MGFTYYLFLITCLTYPFIGYAIAAYIDNEKLIKYRNGLVLFFAIHNILFLIGLSLKGDYSDYIIFSLEYLAICITTFALNHLTNTYLKIVKAVGLITVCIGTALGLVGILVFIIVSMDYESDKIIKFSNADKNYESRRYSFGFATTSDTRYTFETYRTFDILPFEYKIDETDFFDTKTNLDIAEDNLKIEVQWTDTSNSVVFKSTNGNEFAKEIR